MSSSPVPLPCRDVARQLWDYLDGEVSFADRLAIEAHLAGCDDCTSHYTFESRFLAAVHAARPSVAPVEGIQQAADDVALRIRVRGALRAAGLLTVTDSPS